MDVIAERRIDVRYADGETVPVRLRVGRPRPGKSRGEFVCPVSSEGLRIWQGPKEFSGEGSFHALMIGLRFLRNMLEGEVERGAVLYWEGRESLLDLDSLFLLHKPV